jgi:DNA-binding CsgD family transcriptional regulator
MVSGEPVKQTRSVLSAFRNTKMLIMNFAMAQTELSQRQQDVVKLLLEGKSNKQIALALSISERTVEFHLKNIYDKFEVASRVELVLKLGSSTVADRAEIADNRDMLNLRNWAPALKEAFSKISKEPILTSTMDTTTRDPGRPMQFHEAIRVCLIKYADFTGRASRPEFWWFALFITLVASALAYFSQALSSVFMIAVLLPFLAVGTRRLRDAGKSGWWQFFLLVPVGGIVLLGFWWALPPVEQLPDEKLSA